MRLLIKLKKTPLLQGLKDRSLFYIMIKIILNYVKLQNDSVYHDFKSVLRDILADTVAIA